MRKMKGWDNKEKPKGVLCKCGHDHIGWVGDLGSNDDESGWDRIPECIETGCDCEHYESNLNSKKLTKEEKIKFGNRVEFYKGLGLNPIQAISSVQAEWGKRK